MTQPAKAQEPSMEDILASIRRIIADDPPDAAATHSGATTGPMPDRGPRGETESDALFVGLGERAREDAAGRPAGHLENPENLRMDSIQPAGPEPHAQGGPIDAEPAAAATPEPASAAVSPDRMPVHDRAKDEPELLSAATVHLVSSAFNTLADSVRVRNARTLEDIVQEMLRPMLKTWLDDNLPRLVERLVSAEIERVSRGR
jgi:cell pole-organizing protein PopZ